MQESQSAASLLWRARTKVTFYSDACMLEESGKSEDIVACEKSDELSHKRTCNYHKTKATVILIKKFLITGGLRKRNMKKN